MPPRRVGSFLLALVLFLGSLFAGRLIAARPMALAPLSNASPTSSREPDTATPTATSTRTPSETPTVTPPTPTVPVTGTILLDETNTTAYTLPEGCLVHPLRLVARGNDVYALDTGQLKLVTLGTKPACQPILPPQNVVDGVVVQELGDVALSGDRASLLLLDRAGNVFRYVPEGPDWHVERLALAPQASSRQHLVSVSAYGDSFYLLDTNVGQIWQHSGEHAQVIPAEFDLKESADLAVGEGFFVLAQEGYRGPARLRRLTGDTLRPDTDFAPPADVQDPSLLYLDPQQGGHLYVIDQDHQRLRVLHQRTGDLVREYLFAQEETAIWAMCTQNQALYLASRDTILVYPLEATGPVAAEGPPTPEHGLDLLPPHDIRVLDLLPPLTLPIEGTMLTDLSFRLPGAPRSYRYGVHEGIDFYWAAGAAVTSTTPVLSVAEGKIIRVDNDYQPPPAQEMEDLLARAEKAYHTPEDVLDILRGRQVWIDHGDGVISRYCHLSAVGEDLEVGDHVEQGQRIGYVGNSGTPASYYGQGLEMHLHLEIRIGQGYLGQYLRPSEVKRWLNLVFAESP